VGFNNDTYKYYIDFAAKYNFDYVLIDDGWYSYHNRNVMDANPALDIPMLCEYAKGKNIRLILWMVGDAFDKQAEEVCAFYSKMGIAGFKLDFFERQDQNVIARTYSMAQIAAKYKMILNLHGIYVPKGLNRTYPNIVNFESVFGLEQLNGQTKRWQTWQRTTSWCPSCVRQPARSTTLPEPCSTAHAKCSAASTTAP
jgi:alpha-glucosidase